MSLKQDVISREATNQFTNTNEVDIISALAGSFDCQNIPQQVFNAVFFWYYGTPATPARERWSLNQISAGMQAFDADHTYPKWLERVYEIKVKGEPCSCKKSVRLPGDNT